MKVKQKTRFLLSVVCLVVTMTTSISVANAEILEGWDGSVFAGYNRSNGNTKKGSGNLTAEAVKKIEESSSEWKLKGSLTYGETNSAMDTQKWDALVKYSNDFGEDNKWFNFVQTTVDHDYFADIDYRVTPGAGLGYHIARSDEWTWDVDGGLGYRITRHRTNTAADDEVLTAIAHTFMKKQVFEKAYLSEDFTIYPGLKSDAGYVLRSETAFTNPLSESMDLEIKYILDFNSEPAAGKKKSDSQFVSGLKYKF